MQPCRGALRMNPFLGKRERPVLVRCELAAPTPDCCSDLRGTWGSHLGLPRAFVARRKHAACTGPARPDDNSVPPQQVNGAGIRSSSGILGKGGGLPSSFLWCLQIQPELGEHNPGWFSTSEWTKPNLGECLFAFS